MGKILVVDDDRLVLATVAHGLTQAGFDVLSADNGDDAILQAREHRPDLALLDIRMEGMDGFAVAQYLRDYCRIPFMFLSAFADEATVAQVKALGAVAYLVKPVEVGQIVPAVREAFEQLRAPAPVVPAVAAPLADQEALSQVLPIALGVLMHRYSLSRSQALQRLCGVAATERRTPLEQAERLVAAVEELARPAAPSV